MHVLTLLLNTAVAVYGKGNAGCKEGAYLAENLGIRTPLFPSLFHPLHDLKNSKQLGNGVNIL